MEFKVTNRKEKIFDIAKQIFGILAMVIGILGIVFPILPGWILIFVGLELLGIKIVFIDRIKEYALNKINNEKLKNKKGDPRVRKDDTDSRSQG